MVKKRDYSCLIGKSFGRWLVESVGRKGAYAVANCRCSCGTRKEGIRINTLEASESKSCGCLAKELSGRRLRTHGNSRHPLYQAHYDMLRRCYDSSRKDFLHYGGRGIKVCDSWSEIGGLGFSNFLRDSENFEGSGDELDRIDVNGNYEPSNCRWATRKEQTRNTRFNSLITFKDQTKCISEWAEELDIPQSILIDRLGKLGWTVEKALLTPLIRDRHGIKHGQFREVYE